MKIFLNNIMLMDVAVRLLLFIFIKELFEFFSSSDKYLRDIITTFTTHDQQLID